MGIRLNCSYGGYKLNPSLMSYSSYDPASPIGCNICLNPKYRANFLTPFANKILDQFNSENVSIISFIHSYWFHLLILIVHIDIIDLMICSPLTMSLLIVLLLLNQHLNLIFLFTATLLPSPTNIPLLLVIIPPSYSMPRFAEISMAK